MAKWPIVPIYPNVTRPAPAELCFSPSERRCGMSREDAVHTPTGVHMRHILVAAAALVTVPSVPAEAAAPKQITVTSIVSPGPGCPPKSVNSSIAKDRVTLNVNDFSVYGGPLPAGRGAA